MGPQSPQKDLGTGGASRQGQCQLPSDRPGTAGKVTTPSSCPPQEQRASLPPRSIPSCCSPGSRRGSCPHGGFFFFFFCAFLKAPDLHLKQREGRPGMPLSFSPKALIQQSPEAAQFSSFLRPCHLPLNISICLFPNGMFFSKPIFLPFSPRFSVRLGRAGPSPGTSGQPLSSLCLRVATAMARDGGGGTGGETAAPGAKGRKGEEGRKKPRSTNSSRALLLPFLPGSLSLGTLCRLLQICQR